MQLGTQRNLCFSSRVSHVLICRIKVRLIRFLPGPSPFDTRVMESGQGTWKSINIHQQVYALSLVSNFIRKEKDTIDKLAASAKTKITDAVSRLGWNVVWGPAVWKNDPEIKSGPDHVWFVAKKLTYGDENIYAISVAASATIYNHLVNNTAITQVVDFTEWATAASPVPASIILSTGSYVAFGTAQGVHTLLSNKPATDAPGDNKTLSEFLTDARGFDSQFIFTGISLGGTLSPTLALRLVNTGVFTANDDVLVYPIAGASPGNNNFADSFAIRFPKIAETGGLKYQVWNSNIANTIDVAPNGWSTDATQRLRLDRIRTEIYHNEPIEGINWKIDRAEAAANKSSIVYIPIQSTLFTPKAPIPPKNEEEFLMVAIEQHGLAYEDYFGIKLPTESNARAADDLACADEIVDAKEEADIDEEGLFPEVEIGI